MAAAIEEKIKKGKKLMKGLMDVTGNLEALVEVRNDIENGSIAYICGNKSIHFGAIISPDKAEKIKKYCTDTVDEEIEAYDRKLDILLKSNKEAEAPSVSQVNTHIENESTVIELDISDIKSAIKKGITVGQIAEKYGTDKKKIYKFLEKNGTSVKALQP